MEEIVYSPHLTERLKLRSLPYDLPRRLYQRSQERFFDHGTGLSVAVGQGRYRGRVREFAVVYRQAAGVTLLITMHPLKPQQKLARIKSGRWEPRP